jgi:hypothetical protein
MKVDIDGQTSPEFYVCIALPIYGGAEPNFMMSLIGLCLTFASEGIPFSLFPHSDSLITRSRNTIVNDILWEMDTGIPGDNGELVKRQYTHVLQLDCDLVFNPADVVKMLRAKKDVIGGVYPVRGFDWDAIVAAAKAGKTPTEARLAGARYVLNWCPEHRKAEKGEDGGIIVTTDTKVTDGVFEVLDIGTGMLLVTTKALRRMAPKCKKYRYDMPGPKYGRTMRDFFGTYIDSGKRFLSEDYAFCARWKATGGKVYAYATQVNHVGKAVYEGNLANLIVPDGAKEEK